MKISQKLAYAMIGLTMLSVMLSVGVINLTLRDKLEDQVAERQLRTTINSMDRIDDVMRGHYVDIQVLAEESLFTDYLEKHEHVKLGMVDERLGKIVGKSGFWDVMSLIDSEGIVRSSSNQDKMDYVLVEGSNSQVLFEKVMQEGVSYSDVIISPSSGNPTVVYGAPVMSLDDEGKPVKIGVVMAGFSWQVVLELLAKNNQVLQGSSTYLFNQQGLEIGSGDESDWDLILEHDHSEHASWDIISKGEEGFYELVGHDGKTSLQSYVVEHGVLDYEGNGWILVVQTPESVAYSYVREILANLIMIQVIGLIALIIGIGIFVRRNVLNPVKMMAKVAKKLSEGSLSERVGYKSSDELGELSDSFDKMADSLEQSRGDLEKKVDERTSKMEKTMELMVGRELKMKELKKTISDQKAVISKQGKKKK